MGHFAFVVALAVPILGASFACAAPPEPAVIPSDTVAVGPDDNEICDRSTDYDDYSAEQSLQACERLVSSGKLFASDLARAHNNRGVDLETLGRGEEAIEAYLEALSADSTYALAARNLADIYSDREEWHEALRYAELAVEGDPENAGGYRYRAHALRLLERFDSAEADLKIALALDPDNNWTLREMGWLANSRGDFQEAERRFRAAVTSDAENADAHYGLAYVLIDLDRDAEALEAIDRAIDLSEHEHADRLNLRGFLRLQDNKPEVYDLQAAVKDLERAAEIEPQLFYPVYHLAAARALQGRGRDALALLRRGLEMEIDRPKGRRVLRLLLRMGLTEEAAEAAELLNALDDPAAEPEGGAIGKLKKLIGGWAE